MSEQEIKIPMKQITSQLNMKVVITGMRIFTLKKIIAVALFHIAAWILGVGISVQVNDKGKA